MPEVNKVYHANVYIDGTNNQVGRLSEVKLPDLAPIMSEHKAIGQFGTLELPAGLGVLTLTCKWNGYYPDVMKMAADPFRTRRFQIRGNLETYGTEGRLAQVPIIVQVGGRWKKAGGATFKAQESGEFDDEITCNYYRCEVDGRELYEIDVVNNIWKVDGRDLLEILRKNLGLI